MSAGASPDGLAALAQEVFSVMTSTGRIPDARFAPGARIGLAPTGIETGARVQPQAAAGGRGLEILDTAHWRLSDTEHAFVARVDGDTTRTVTAVLEVGRRGVERYLEFRTPRECVLAPSDDPQETAAPADRRYLDRLDRGDAVGAAAEFSEDALYSHPPYVDDPARTSVVTGRARLHRSFDSRGRRSFTHEIRRDGVNALGTVVEGVVPEVRGTFGSFLSLVQLTPAGEISRYMAFYGEPGLR